MNDTAIDAGQTSRSPSRKVLIGRHHPYVDPSLSAEGVLDRWDEIVDERDAVIHPTTAAAVAYREARIAEQLAAEQLAAERLAAAPRVVGD